MRIEDGFLRLEENEIEVLRKKGVKKITGTTFGAILGYNNFEKKGDAILKLFRVIPKEEIDPFYTNRGYLAEVLIWEYLNATNQTYMTWNPEDIKYDNFPKNTDFGGMIDIGVSKPLRYLIEVKSTNVVKKDDVLKNKSYICQGKLYGELSKTKKIVMSYVLFTDEEEQAIRENDFIADENQMKKMLNEGRIIFREYNIDFEEVQKAKEKALMYKDECIYLYNYAVPLEDISKKTLEKLGFKTPESETLF